MTPIQFSEQQEAEVDAARRQRVLVAGEVTPDTAPGTLQLRTVVAIPDDREFWNPPSIDELIRRQGVKPVDTRQLGADFWEEDDIDEFLAELRRWRDES
jgi:hypothetical protein